MDEDSDIEAVPIGRFTTVAIAAPTQTESNRSWCRRHACHETVAETTPDHATGGDTEQCWQQKGM